MVNKLIPAVVFSLVLTSSITGWADPYNIHQSIINKTNESIFAQVSTASCIEPQTIEKAEAGWAQGVNSDSYVDFWGENQCSQSSWTWLIKDQSGKQATVHCSTTAQNPIMTCGVYYGSSPLPIHVIWTSTRHTTEIDVGGW